MSFLTFLHRVANRENLTEADARQAMELVLDGSATTAQISGFLVALRMKGETADELIGFARAMRSKGTRVLPNLDGQTLLDTCGTGGGGPATFNISTVAVFVSAGAGVRVAKHGNRSISTLCGSADVLEGLGVDIAQPTERIAQAIREVGIGFMFAPAMHPAMKHAQPARQEIKMRTAFNLLGPLTNPAGATAQLVGAPSANAAELMAKALASLGLQRGFVVHGSDGLDEITTTGESLVLEINHGVIVHHQLRPEDFGVATATLDDLRGGDRQQSVEIFLGILNGQKGPKRDIVLVNAAAALVAAGRAHDFAEGMELARQSIDSGAAMQKLEHLRMFTKN
jgi:anthranilate phosphoribosyltransferase